MWPSLLHPRDLAVQLAARLRIEAGRRLVEEDELGLVHEREREREPLPLAARQRVERRVGLVGQREALEQRRRRRRCRGRTTPKSASASRGVILSWSAVVCSAAPMFCLTSRGRRRASMPQTSIAPASGSRSPMMHSTVVVLPAPFGPEEPEDLAVVDLEAHAARGFDAAVALVQIANADFGSGLKAQDSGLKAGRLRPCPIYRSPESTRS